MAQEENVFRCAWLPALFPSLKRYHSSTYHMKCYFLLVISLLVISSPLCHKLYHAVISIMRIVMYIVELTA